MDTLRIRGFSVFTSFLLFIASTPLIAASPIATDMGVRIDMVRVAVISVVPIDFGTVLINGDSGGVTMEPGGGVNYYGGVIQVQGYPQIGELTLDGASGLMATINFPSVVDMGNGVEFRPEADRTMLMLTDMPETVRVFGEISFPNATSSGTHFGLLPIEVTYN